MADGGRPDQRTTIGAIMVLVGLGFFVAIFVALFPVLTDPVETYDRWFPQEVSDEVAEAPIEVPTTSTIRPTVGPTARFAWEAIGTEAGGPTAARVRLVSASTPGDVDIVATRWELGDGTTARGETITHDYAALGSYAVVLRVTDSNGEVDSIRGTVSATGDPSGFGAADVVRAGALDLESPLDDFGTGLSDSLEDAVGDVGEDINATIDTALGSIGSTVRGGVVVALFALAAFAATIVAWRTSRIGVMLLLADPDAGARRRRSRTVDREEQPPRHLEAA